MADELKQQNLANHTRLDPAFHYFLAPLFLFNIFVCAWQLYRHPGWFTGWLVFLAVAMMVLVFKVRIYPLKVQDRVIRIEERLRLLAVLPEPLRARIHELGESQLVALRFAADSELPELVNKTLDGNLPSKEIKKLIQSWRADHYRV